MELSFHPSTLGVIMAGKSLTKKQRKAIVMAPCVALQLWLLWTAFCQLAVQPVFVYGTYLPKWDHHWAIVLIGAEVVGLTVILVVNGLLYAQECVTTWINRGK